MFYPRIHRLLGLRQYIIIVILDEKISVESKLNNNIMDEGIILLLNNKWVLVTEYGYFFGENTSVFSRFYEDDLIHNIYDYCRNILN